ncbi:hypothetical protein [Neorickettsia sp. 179522]|uniref:hypothetical protein n=1 Tax=Neorickettsia sp. 179522 TaxID=1714371 RepID=UPI000793CFDE|nr:hypothetical protein [Neorickettsia sp. 179522]KYH12438.1 hypothetical protein AS219_01320 [Neorickettsia sp. 179522]
MPQDLLCYSPILPADADAAVASQSTLLQAGRDLGISGGVVEAVGTIRQCDVLPNSQENGRERG